MTKQILLNDVERRLLTAQGHELQRAHATMEQLRNQISAVAEAARAEWDETVSAVVNGRTMRERPPITVKPAYDEAQGALVWEVDEAIVEVDPPQTETTETLEAVTT